ncbi:MAG: acyltransferase [Flavobacteriaceae bacterium]|nr:acyltransferase [Flavobacteriaceae bacterium]
MRILNNVQYLRGIAALLVCGFHTQNWISNVYGYNLGKFLFGKGDDGVELFFIISGFIMVYTTKNMNLEIPYKNIKEFLKKRAIRIMPLYTILTMFWIWIFIPDFSYNYVNVIKIIKSIFFIPYDKFPILYLGWTLNYEMFFYLVFAASFCFKRYRYYALTLFFLLQFGLQFFEFNDIRLQFVNAPIVSYFFSGVLIGLLVDKVKIKYYKSYLIGAWVLLVLYFLDFIQINNQYLQFLFLSIVVFMIVLGDFYLELVPFNVLLFLGNISYSIYLIHPFVSGFVLMNFISWEDISMEYRVVFYMLLILLTILISYILYILVEQKLTRMLKKLIS